MKSISGNPGETQTGIRLSINVERRVFRIYQVEEDKQVSEGPSARMLHRRSPRVCAATAGEARILEASKQHVGFRSTLTEGWSDPQSQR